jgi:TonB family protein
MTAIAQALSSALLHFVWQGVVVAFLLWAALILLRRSSAQARYMASCIALAALVVLPAITAWVVYARPAAALPVANGVAALVQPGTLPAAPSAPSMPWIAILQSWALPVWSLGVLLFSIRLVWGCRQVSLLRRRGGPADAGLMTLVAALAKRLGVEREVRVLIASHAESPSVVGWFRPVILVPAATLLGLATDQLEAVLAHELAHIRRHDYIVNMLQTLAETLLFYHPAVWWASARMRHERELCCDDMAVRCCGDAICYARALTRLERLRLTRPSMAMSSTGGSMLYRVRRLVGAAPQGYAPSKLPGILALALGIVCFGLNLHRASGQEKPRITTGIARTSSAPDGPGVQVDLGGSAVLHRNAVEYPGPAWERRIEGTVLVEVSLDGTGMVNDARVLAGPAELRKSVLHSVLEWHFAPDANNTTRRINISFHRVAGQLRSEGQVTVNSVPGVVTITAPSITYRAAGEGAEPQSREQRAKLEAAQSKQLSDLMAGRLEPQSQQQRAERERTIADAQEELTRLHQEDLTHQQEQAALTQEFLKEEISQFRAEYQGKLQQLEQTQGTAGAEQAKRELQAAEAHYVDLQRKLAAAGEVVRFEEARRPTGSGALAGRTLQSIRINGLSDELKSALLGKLPVHIGDTLTPQTIEAMTKAVKQIDQHLEVNLGEGENGQAELHITVPGSGGNFWFRGVQK